MTGPNSANWQSQTAARFALRNPRRSRPMSTSGIVKRWTALGPEARRIHWRATQTLSEIARWLNPALRGWFNYFIVFYPSHREATL